MRLLIVLAVVVAVAKTAPVDMIVPEHDYKDNEVDVSDPYVNVDVEEPVPVAEEYEKDPSEDIGEYEPVTTVDELKPEYEGEGHWEYVEEGERNRYEVDTSEESEKELEELAVLVAFNILADLLRVINEMPDDGH